MAKRPIAMGERMAICAARLAHNAGADVRDESVRSHHAAQAGQVAIGPCGQHIAVQAGAVIIPVPRDTEPVAIDGQLCL